MIEDIAEKVKVHLIKEYSINSINSFNDLAIPNDTEEDLVNKMHHENSIVSISTAILLLRKLYHINEGQIDLLIELGNKYGLSSLSNFVYTYKDISDHTDDSLKKFIVYFIKNYVIIRHQWVALRKMNDTQSTEKFIREDGLIRYLDLIEYGYSTPRLNTVLSFFEDMQLIERGSRKLTIIGNNLLSNLDS